MNKATNSETATLYQPPHDSPSSTPNNLASSAPSAPSAASSSSSSSGSSAGALLRRMREQQNVHLSEIASALKVPISRLEALERDDWSSLPDTVFTRSLTLSICRHLRVDAAPIMALLPQVSTTILNATGGLNEPVRHRGVPSALGTSGSGGSGAKRLIVALVMLILIGALAFVLTSWFNTEPDDPEDFELSSVPEEIEEQASAERAQELEALQAAAASAASAAASADATDATSATDATGATDATNSADAVNSNTKDTKDTKNTKGGQLEPPKPAVEAPVSANPAAAPASVPTLRVQANNPTWIQVRDGQGKVIHESMLKANEVYENLAPKPFSVIIGQAEGALVQIDGKAFDLSSSTRGNVARFDIK